MNVKTGFKEKHINKTLRGAFISHSVNLEIIDKL